jgi:hypothetical protein
MIMKNLSLPTVFAFTSLCLAMSCGVVGESPDSGVFERGLVADNGNGPEDTTTTDAPIPDVTEEEGDDDACECEFTTYNLDVRVGDQFVLSNFVSCDGLIRFDYEDGEDWNLDNFNTDRAVTIVESDLLAGNKSEGRYRLQLFDDTGEELDHMTIRINHDDESDIQPGDEIPGQAPTVDCSEDDDDDTDDDDGDDDDGGGPTTSTPPTDVIL